MILVYDISSMSPANDFISIKYMYDIIQNVYIIYKRRFFSYDQVGKNKS